MKNIIYYFSGTGNSYTVAKIIGQELGNTELISAKCSAADVSAKDASVIGFVCPVYEWDIPDPMNTFIKELEINPNAYIFMVATYIFVHGKCFETVNTLLSQKGGHLSYGKALRCVASQCTAYEPFPSPKYMVPHSEKGAHKIAKEIAVLKNRNFPKMSPISRRLYGKMMVPFKNVQVHYDKGFYASDACIGCGLCSKICACHNITIENGKPLFHHSCVGCMSCVAYCPKKAIQFQTPKEYLQLNNAISKKLKLPETRTRYHHPKVSAANLIKERTLI